MFMNTSKDFKTSETIMRQFSYFIAITLKAGCVCVCVCVWYLYELLSLVLQRLSLPVHDGLQLFKVPDTGENSSYFPSHSLLLYIVTKTMTLPQGVYILLCIVAGQIPAFLAKARLLF